jgi:6-phosphogluconolactonase
MRTWKLWIPGLLTVFLLACGGGNDGGGQPQTYTVGGSIQGLTVNRLSLANGSNLITPAANATSFVFPTQLTSGASYSVAVQAQPLGLTCTVSSGTGNVGSTNVTNIVVTCVPAVPAETNLHYFV